jgi:mitochondrial distribution and morphology protein 34
MAFNFNWSPLATDASFYQRAKELLTNALNRAGPRPVIIVDDFLVSEFNLGEIPPELEIVEIGDLAEDKFRGTFKMRYQGDAVLSLKTKVQANPLNNHLATRNAFATPQPLAAATGLTIPLQITLSEIRLSGFVILVFSKQKGLTIVFKDDPLESLRVSSTFDSIPFVANHIQKEIEKQLRNLLMEELPAIIHRLSQSFWAPEQRKSEEPEQPLAETGREGGVVDPLASPPQDPVDSKGNVLTPAEVASLSLDSSVETQSLFSQKNLIRLATLTDSHRTLSLFTPSIKDAVFRAWTGPLERGEMPAFQSRAATPALSRTHSHAGSLSAWTGDSAMSRPSLYSFPSTAPSHGLGAGRHGKNRKRKKRVVNLRKKPESEEMETVVEDGSTVTDSASVTESTSEAPSVFSAPNATAMSPTLAHGQDLSSSPASPKLRRPLHQRRVISLTGAERGESSSSSSQQAPQLARSNTSSHPASPTQPARYADQAATIRARRHETPTQGFAQQLDMDVTPRASMYVSKDQQPARPVSMSQHERLREFSTPEKPPPSQTSPAASDPQISGGQAPLPNFMQFLTDPSSNSSGSIAERAWMAKMVGEMGRRYEEERAKGTFGGSYNEASSSPPPAYAR